MIPCLSPTKLPPKFCKVLLQWHLIYCDFCKLQLHKLFFYQWIHLPLSSRLAWPFFVNHYKSSEAKNESKLLTMNAAKNGAGEWNHVIYSSSTSLMCCPFTLMHLSQSKANMGHEQPVRQCPRSFPFLHMTPCSSLIQPLPFGEFTFTVKELSSLTYLQELRIQNWGYRLTKSPSLPVLLWFQHSYK